MRVFLTMGRDGRILVQARVEYGSVLGDVCQYVGQGEQFMGADYATLSQATPGPFDIPEQPDSSGIEPDTSPLPPEPEDLPQGQ